MCAVVSAASAMGALSAFAESISLSFDETVEMAVERNNALKNAALDVRMAKANKWAAIAAMLPQISGSADYSNFMGYEMDLRGMTIAMPPYVTLGVRTSMTFNGAMLVNAQLSEISRKMADISLQQSEQDIVNQAKTLYFSALVSMKVLDLLNRNLDCLEKLYEMTNTSVSVGASEQTAADQIAVQVAQLKNSFASTNRALEMTYNSMRLLLDLDVDTEIYLTDPLELLMTTGEYMELIGEDFDVERNYSYQLMQQNTEMSRKQLEATKLGATPSVSAYHQYSFKEYLSKDANVMNMTPPNMVGVTLSVPIFTSLQQTKKVDAARMAYEKQLNTMHDTEQSLLVQHRQLCFNLATAYDTYNTQLQNLEVTQRVFDNISKRYEQGYSSAMDLTTTGTTLINAQSAYIQSVMEFLNARLALEKLLNK